MAKKMKLKVVVELDVDREAWADEYGIDPSEVVDDLRMYLMHMIQDSYPASERMVVVESAKATVRR
jgi:hypothetical protein